jgi:hypothetical protein
MISQKRAILNLGYLINICSLILSAAIVYDQFGLGWLIFGLTFFPGMWIFIPFYAAFELKEFWPLIILMFGIIVPIYWVITNPKAPD